ncbi:MAG: chromosomal replication initiator protein DnaA [Planctomycetota bacterium]|nr:MAG: chromosomal replication initiator protein DnaA [Planctomycetota bacterium]
MAKATEVFEPKFRGSVSLLQTANQILSLPVSKHATVEPPLSDPHCDDLESQRTVACRVTEAFQKRIGPERYAVWFGGAVHVSLVRSSFLPENFDGDRVLADKGIDNSVSDPNARDNVCVIVSIDGDLSPDWLRKRFQTDFDAAVFEVCGRSLKVVWQTPTPAFDQPIGTETSVTPAAPDPADQTAEVQQTEKLSCAPPDLIRTVVSTSRARVQKQTKGILTISASQTMPCSTLARKSAPGLEAFVVGPSNRMAFAAVELASARPGEMSPLVLHGPSGVGKTHLIEAMCGHIRQLHPGRSVLYLSAEQFTTSFLQALHGSGLPGFRRTCRSADVLAIDDLQFFIGKRATIVELQHTVDALHRQGKQLIFACDRENDALTDLGPDLVARLKGGMNAPLLSPDYDVRHGIVSMIALQRGLSIPADVIQFIATHMTRHARELAGAVNRLEATSHMLGLPITASMAADALSDLVRSNTRSMRLADIERAVCSAFGIETGSLQSSRRAKIVNHPRMLAMFLARKHTPAALTEIGTYFGRRSHSTVISAQKTVSEWVSQRSQIVLAESKWDVADAIRRVEDVLRAG